MNEERMMGLVQKIGQMLCLSLALVACAIASVRPQGPIALRGQVADQQGGAISGATVTLIDSNNVEKTATTNDQGIYVFTNLAPGKYFLRAIANGFALYENEAV